MVPNAAVFRLWLRRIVWLMLLYSCYRLLFAAMNHSVLLQEPHETLIRAFVRGLRFDFWAVLWTHLPILLTAFLPLVWQFRLDQVVHLYMALVNFVFTGFNVVDSELFKFAGKRVSREWFFLQGDVTTQGFSLVSYYWWLGTLGLVLWAIWVWFWPRMKMAPETLPETLIEKKSSGREDGTSTTCRRVVLTTFYAAWLILGLRGGWQWKPLNLAHAFTEGSPVVGSMTLNSTISLLKSSDKIESLALHFLSEDERHKTLALHRPEASPYFGQARRFNVVILIVESLGLEYLGEEASSVTFLPWLKSLSEKSLFFTQNYANGRRSIEAVPSVICGLPSLMSEAFILSPYQSINLNCLGQMAKSEGYSTLFFHGAHNGSMHFDSFAQRAGFDKYFGFDEFPDRTESDGQWGIFDEPFLKFVGQRLTEEKRPFVATIFTLSSHHPYRIPTKYQGQFPKGNLEIHESLGYVDLSLKNFFAQIRTEPWFEKTIFFITGDHTAKSADPKFQDLVGVYRVPLILYAPGLKLKASTGKITQHVDILPTIRDLLGWSRAGDLPFGRSVLTKEGMAINATAQGFWLLSEVGLAEYRDATKSFHLVAVRPGLEGAQAVLGAQLWLKALIDEFNQGLIHNRLVPAQTP